MVLKCLSIAATYTASMSVTTFQNLGDVTISSLPLAPFPSLLSCPGVSTLPLPSSSTPFPFPPSPAPFYGVGGLTPEIFFEITDVRR